MQVCTGKGNVGDTDGPRNFSLLWIGYCPNEEPGPALAPVLVSARRSNRTNPGQRTVETTSPSTLPSTRRQAVAVPSDRRRPIPASGATVASGSSTAHGTHPILYHVGKWACPSLAEPITGVSTFIQSTFDSMFGREAVKKLASHHGENDIDQLPLSDSETGW
jgi:hypothetical protein